MNKTKYIIIVFVLIICIYVAVKYAVIIEKHDYMAEVNQSKIQITVKCVGKDATSGNVIKIASPYTLVVNIENDTNFTATIKEINVFNKNSNNKIYCNDKAITEKSRQIYDKTINATFLYYGVDLDADAYALEIKYVLDINSKYYEDTAMIYLKKQITKKRSNLIYEALMGV